MRDLFSNVKMISGTVAAPTDNTAIVSPIVDKRDYSAILFAIVTGTLGDASAEFTTLLEESNASDMSGANAVADADLHGLESAASFTQANDNAVFKLGYRGTKRYTRLTVTPTNNATAAPIGILALGKPLAYPAT
jgi:hypothetical protein